MSRGLSRSLLDYLALCAFFMAGISSCAAVRGDEVATQPAQALPTWAFPPLDNQLNQLRTMISLQKTIPGFFDQIPAFDVALFAVMDDIRRYQRELAQDPEYVKAMNDRKFLEIVIQPQKGPGIVRKKVLEPESLEGWKADIDALLLTLPREKPPRVEAEKEMRILGIYLQDKSSAGLMNGLLGQLMRTLPAEKKKLNFGRGNFEEVISFLGQNLPDPVPDSFLSKRQGIQANPSKRDVLDAIRKIRDSEERLSALADLDISLDVTGVGLGTSMSRARELIRDAQSSALISLGDPDQVQPQIERLGKNGVSNKSWLENQIKLKVGKRLTYVETEVENPLQKIRLTEQAPWVAGYRGFVAGDCSTRFSMKYAFGMRQRHFFIGKSEGESANTYGEPEGYTTLVRTDAENKPSIYIPTINGPEISSQETLSILSGVKEARKALGSTQEFVPIEKQSSINILVNYQPIVDAYAQARSLETVPMEYNDSSLRLMSRILNTHTHSDKHDHDGAGANSTGIRLNEANLPPVSITVREIPHEELPTFKPDEPIDPTDLMNLLLAFKKSNRSVDNGILFRITEMKASDVEDAYNIITNSKGLPVDQYKLSMKRWADSHNIKLELILKQNTTSTFRGYFAAPDSLEKAHSAESSARMLDYIKANPGVGMKELLRGFYGQEKGRVIISWLASDPAYKKYISRRLENFSNLDTPEKASKLRRLQIALPFNLPEKIQAQLGDILTREDTVGLYARMPFTVAILASAPSLEPSTLAAIQKVALDINNPNGPKIAALVATHLSGDPEAKSTLIKWINSGTVEEKTRANEILIELGKIGKINDFKPYLVKALDEPEFQFLHKSLMAASSHDMQLRKLIFDHALELEPTKYGSKGYYLNRRIEEA